MERVHLWKPYWAKVSDLHFDTIFQILNKARKIINKWRIEKAEILAL
jgi:hypothetical protein